MAAKLIKEHNTNVLQSLEKGDMVEIKRSFLYSHWAVYAGEGKVIHLTGDDNNWSFNTVVKLEDFWKVVDGCKCYQHNFKYKKMRFNLRENVCLTMAAISIEEHNTRVLQSLDEGDLVEIDRGFYSHWAVYAGGEMVIHLTSDYNNVSSAFSNYGSVFTICGETFDKAYVKLEEFSKVVKGYKSYKNNSKDTKMRPDEAQEIVQRGLDMLGKMDYNVLSSNCEHFASFCRYGKFQSDQADFPWIVIHSIVTTIELKVAEAEHRYGNSLLIKSTSRLLFRKLY